MQDLQQEFYHTHAKLPYYIPELVPQDCTPEEAKEIVKRNDKHVEKAAPKKRQLKMSQKMREQIAAWAPLLKQTKSHKKRVQSPSPMVTSIRLVTDSEMAAMNLNTL